MTYLNMDQQVCVIKNVAYRARTDTLTDTGTDKKVKTEGVRIMYITFGYLPTVIIGGPMYLFKL